MLYKVIIRTEVRWLLGTVVLPSDYYLTLVYSQRSYLPNKVWALLLRNGIVVFDKASLKGGEEPVLKNTGTYWRSVPTVQALYKTSLRYIFYLLEYLFNYLLRYTGSVLATT